ncbi:transglycosylase family protein [Tomitella biformata]|uniref:LysM peptidoglycan-binding domain-containing protein n=1 Tax=Tomitella biformata TaxID=630403 RepID=UPI0004663951|nr:transglycosylase family protein [Tomitella biformata]
MTSFSIKRILGTTATAAAIVAIPLAMGAGTASAAGGHDWSGVAECESSGNWAANTGNGYQGGLQFSPSTWAAYGGTGNAADASQSEQIRVAENVLEGQGVGAWPVCGQQLTGGSTPGSESAPQQAPVQTAPVQETSAVQSTPISGEAGNYLVEAGDTLSKIAQAHGVSLDALADQVHDINLIFVGQTLNV